MTNFSKLFMIPMLFATTLNACNNSQNTESNHSTEQVATSEEKSLKDLVKEGAYLVDVRSPEEFAAGTVPGAVNIPLGEVESRIGDFKDKSHVIVFCASGNRSGQAKRKLEEAGITNVTNGGAWGSVKTAIQ